MVASEESGSLSALVATAATKTVTNVTASSTRVRRRGTDGAVVAVASVEQWWWSWPHPRAAGPSAASERAPDLDRGLP